MRISRPVYRTQHGSAIMHMLLRGSIIDFKNSIKSHHGIKNSSFVKHFAKETRTCPIIKSKNIQFHTDILTQALKNDITISTKIPLKFKDSAN